MQIILAILVLMLLVLVHEWGHFIAARKIGVPVEEFSVGFGPLLASKERRGVQYSLRGIPLGGYVRMTGEEDELDAPDGFMNRKPWEKIVIAAAGPAMNFVAAIVLFIFVFSILGMPQSSMEPVLGGTVEEGPAAEAGLLEGDRILEVDGHPVTDWNEITGIVSVAAPGKNITVTFERGGEQKTVTVQPYYDEERGRALIGIYSSVTYERVSIMKAIPEGFKYTWEMTSLLLEGLAMLVTGQVGADDISGPVGITAMIGDAARSGTITLLTFMALLSVNLGLMNLLPIPALDGSKILFAAVEWIRGKRLPREREAMVHWIGLVVLLGLMALATFNDIERLIRGG